MTDRQCEVSKTTAARVLGCLDTYESPERAAHEIQVQLDAIRPYTDRQSEAVLAVLRKLARWDAEKRARNVDTLRGIVS